MQGVRVRVTPLWQLTTSQSSSALLELPMEDLPDSARLAAALVICRQPHAQVRLYLFASCALSQRCTMHNACNCKSCAGGIVNIATALTVRHLHAQLSCLYLIVINYTIALLPTASQGCLLLLFPLCCSYK